MGKHWKAIYREEHKMNLYRIGVNRVLQWAHIQPVDSTDPVLTPQLRGVSARSKKRKIMKSL